MLRSALLVATAALVLAVPSSAAAPKSYKNCAALNKDYPNGVGKPGAKDKTSRGKPVTTFTRSANVYKYNDGKAPKRKGERNLDRDGDGIACEKK